MLTVVHSALTAAMRRLLQESAVEGDLSAAVEANRKGLAQLSECLVKNPAIIDVHTHRLEMDWRAEGVPEDLACRAALVPVLVSAFGLTELAAKTKLRMSDLAAIFFGFEKRLNISWLGRLATVATAQTPWQREAASVALEELAANHRRLTAQLAMKQVKSKAGGKEQSLDSWVAAHHVALDRYDAMLAEWHAAGVVDLAMLLLANERLHALSA
jgi:NAD-specific glutamate dehydrogenase